MNPTLHPGPSELAHDLGTVTLPGCAALVREGLRAAAPAIVEAVRGVSALYLRHRSERDLLAAHVEAWGRGDDDAVARSNNAWRASGECAACARLALASAGAGSCEHCAESAAEEARS
ncbi:MAG: hypothetical protein EPO40_06145 [Myxococcaceae bacterium]|nr:MAG: hypothetical protein EPO40_06145 [Myxococcaceae bacterium]